MMNPRVNRALDQMEDSGVWVDVIRLRSFAARQRKATGWERSVKKMEDFVFQERRTLTMQQNTDKAEMGRVRMRLINACVVGRIQRTLALTTGRNYAADGPLHGTRM